MKLLLATAACALALTGVAGAADFRFLGTLPGGLEVAADLQGTVHIADAAGNAVRRYTPGRAALAPIGSAGTAPGQLAYPAGVAVAPDGDVFVADSDNLRIQRFSAAGAYEHAWAYGTSTSRPTSLAADAAGRVYAVRINVGQVTMTDASGTLIRRFGAGSQGAGDGQLDSPGGMDVDAAGNVYVADTDNHRVMKFSPLGSMISTWGYGVAGGSGWQVCTSSCAAGVEFSGMPGLVSSSDPFEAPRDVAIQPDGTVLVADTLLVRRFSEHGALLGTLGTRSTGNAAPPAAEYRTPTYLAADCRGRVYVIDTAFGGKTMQYGDPDASTAPCAAGPPDPGPGTDPPGGDPAPVGTAGTGQTGAAPAPPADPGPSLPPRPSGGSTDVSIVVADGVTITSTGTAADLTVTTPGAGTVTAGPAGGRARAAAAKRPAALVGTVRRTVARAGRVKLRVALTKSGRAQLRRAGKVPVTLKITFTPRTGAASSRTKRVTFRRPRATPRR